MAETGPFPTAYPHPAIYIDVIQKTQCQRMSDFPQEDSHIGIGVEHAAESLVVWGSMAVVVLYTVPLEKVR